MKFEFVKIKRSEYTIQPKVSIKLKQGDRLVVRFTRNITSTSNSLLSYDDLSFLLHESESDLIVTQIKKLKSLGPIGASAAVGASIGSSAMMSDPTYFFNFLTTVEIYTYVALYHLEFDPSLRDFFNSIQMQSKIPNIFDYLSRSNHTNYLKQKFIDFGYDTNLILINSGVFFTATGTVLALYPFLNMIRPTRFLWLNEKIRSMRDSYQYRFFLRTFVQSFFEICLNSILGIVTFKYEGNLEFIDFCICITCLVFFN